MKSCLAALFKGANTTVLKQMTFALAAFSLLAQLVCFATPAIAAAPSKSSPPLAVRGYSVSINEDGNIAVVGTDAGWVYVYYRSNNGWLQKAAFSSSSAADHFGHSVAISGDGRTIVVGAPYAGGGYGEAHIYTVEYDSSGAPVWSPTALLSTRTDAPQFGGSVAINQNGDAVVIGSGADDTSDSGSAFVFRYSNGNWIQQVELALLATGWSGGDRFGGSVAINRTGTKVMVGAWNTIHSTQSDGKTPNLDGVGAVYLFKYDSSSESWSLSQQIPGLSSGDNFGRSLAFNSSNSGTAVDVENYVIIGAPGRNNSEGAAYLYSYGDSGWSLFKEFTAPSPASGNEYGYSVALQGCEEAPGYYRTEALIGARNRNASQGVAYVYTYSTRSPYWFLYSTYAPAATKGTTTVKPLFGSSVAINGDGNTVVAGAPTQITGQGSTYIYDYSSRQVVINSATLPTGRVGYVYPGGTITTKNGYGSYSWKWSGKIPPGLFLNPQGDGSSASISGQPIQAGKYSFTVSVTCVAGTVSKNFTVTITK